MEYIFSLLYVLMAFTLILVLSRKVQLGYALFAGTVLLGLLFRMDITSFFFSIYRASIDPATVELVVSIFLILLLSESMKNSGQMENIVKSTIILLHNIKLATFFLPALIGLLPMPGGAYFSAPMVDSALKGTTLSAPQKTFANYWFRHVWEYINPIYPGIVAVSALTGLKFSRLVSYNIFLTLTAIIAGVIITFFAGKSDFPEVRLEYRGSMDELKRLLKGIVPVIIILSMVLFLNVSIIVALITGNIIFIFVNRLTLKRTLNAFKKAASVKMLLMLLGISFFQHVLNDCGAVEGIAAFLESTGIGVMPVIFGISFLSGFVTGITIAFVGLSLPIILPLMPQITAGSMMFVFAAGFGGVLLSPVHLCLVMSCEYFRANMPAVYKYLIPATLTVMAAGFIGGFF